MAIDVAEILGVQGRKTVVGKHLATHPIHMRKTIAELDAAGMSAAADTLIWVYWHYKLKETNLDAEREDAWKMRDEFAILRAENEKAWGEVFKLREQIDGNVKPWER